LSTQHSSSRDQSHLYGIPAVVFDDQPSIENGQVGIYLQDLYGACELRSKRARKGEEWRERTSKDSCSFIGTFVRLDVLPKLLPLREFRAKNVGLIKAIHQRCDHERRTTTKRTLFKNKMRCTLLNSFFEQIASQSLNVSCNRYLDGSSSSRWSNTLTGARKMIACTATSL
jgi:hypothetical protein